MTTPRGFVAATICFVISISAQEGGGIPRRVIMHQHDGRRRQIERPFHHLAHIDGCVVHGSLLLYFVGDDLIALIEKQDTKPLLTLEAH